MQRSITEEKTIPADPQLIFAYDADGMAFTKAVIRKLNHSKPHRRRTTFNKVLIKHTQNLLKLKNSQKTPIFVSGSNRQDEAHDRKNAGAFKTPMFRDYLPRLVKKVDSRAIVDMFWLQDIFGNGEIPFDHQKLMLLLGLLFHFETEYPGPF